MEHVFEEESLVERRGEKVEASKKSGQVIGKRVKSRRFSRVSIRLILFFFSSFLGYDWKKRNLDDEVS